MKGNVEKFEVEIPGRVMRTQLYWRHTKTSFNLVNFHGYGFGKKGSRSKIDLMENLRGKKGLSKKKPNILGGNFNFVEFQADRKNSSEDSFAKDKSVRDFFVVLSKNFNLYVRRNLRFKSPHFVILGSIC